MKRAIHDLKRMDCLWISVPLPTHTVSIIKISFNADKIILMLIILYTPFCQAPPQPPQKKPKPKPNPEVILVFIFSTVKYART